MKNCLILQQFISLRLDVEQILKPDPNQSGPVPYALSKPKSKYIKYLKNVSKLIHMGPYEYLQKFMSK